MQIWQFFSLELQNYHVNVAKRQLKDKIGIEYEVALKDREVPLDSTIMKVGEF